MVELLLSLGWQVLPEVSFSHYGDRGSIDVLAWRDDHLLVIEVKGSIAAAPPAPGAAARAGLRMAAQPSGTKHSVRKRSNEALVRPSSSDIRAGSIEVKLKQDLPCIRRRSSGDRFDRRSGHM